MATNQPAYEQIAYEVLGPVVRISHNRPALRNAESMKLLTELDDAVRTATADADIRVLIIAGKGDHFSAGHDLKEAQASRQEFTVEGRWAYEEQYYLDTSLRLWDCPKPTIAQVQGACIAGGFMVANMCDLVIASEDAFFADPVCQTLAAAAVEVLIHPYVMSTRKAKEMLFTGRRLSAQEGYDIGMVNKVVKRAELEAETLKMAELIAKAEPFALKIVKRSLNRALDMAGMRNAIQAHFDTHQLSHVSEAFKATRSAGGGLAAAIQRAKT